MKISMQEADKIRRECEAKNNPLPKCPNCGSDKVWRISSGEKIGSTMALGFFNNKRKQQFECMNPNCGYKW